MSTTQTANPGPLGLAGFGMATMLLNIHNAGFFPVDVTIVAMGIFVGGLIQVLVGAWEWKSNNMFGMVAFSGYGFFWLTLGTIFILPNTSLAANATSASMGCYLTIWGIFTFGLWYATLRMNKWMQTLFMMVVVLFALLALGKFTGNHMFNTIAGYEGILCGALALYMAIAQVINNVNEKQVLPV